MSKKISYLYESDHTGGRKPVLIEDANIQTRHEYLSTKSNSFLIELIDNLIDKMRELRM